MKLLGYIRVSTEEQAENGRSLEVQDQQLQKYCDMHGHELVDVFTDEGVSASVPLDRRLAGAALLEAIRTGRAEGILIQRLDRLFRIGLDAVTTATAFRERGIDLLAVQESIDLATKDGWLTFFFKAGLAEYERLTISERATEVSNSLREQGRVYGPVPYGCVNIDGRLYRDPDTWRIRELIVGLRADEHSYRTISSILFDKKIPSPTGGKHWHSSTIRGLISGHAQLEHIPLSGNTHEAQVSALHKTGDA